jgi:DNA-binding transcriptional LysR family regulator
VEWCRYVGLELNALKVKYVTEDWRTVQHLVEQGLGFAIVPFYVQNFSPQVQRAEVPAGALRGLDFYAIYESGLKKIPAFKELLTFARVKI